MTKVNNLLGELSWVLDRMLLRLGWLQDLRSHQEDLGGAIAALADQGTAWGADCRGGMEIVMSVVCL
jgi:hypothetical protein